MRILDMASNYGEQESTSPVHKPLKGARDIRLIRILPKNDSSYGFELELSLTSLDNPIPYVALSYTWEAAEVDRATGKAAPENEHYISCSGGGTIKVTDNLLNFLQLAARKEAGDSQGTWYWIDQISINQEDSLERNLQVAMMGDVYKSADSIRVWMGKTDPSPQFLWVYWTFIPRVLQLETVLNNRGISLEADSWDCSTPEMIEGLGAEVCKKWRQSHEDFFWFFYTRRWFLRAWIFQEVTLRDVSLIHISCGQVDLEWQVFDSFIRFVERSSWHHSLPYLYVSWEEKLVGPMLPLSNLLKGQRYVDMKVRGGSELENWLSNFTWDIGPQDGHQIWFSIYLHFLRTNRFMSARNPRDHVYSLLGIMAEFLPPGMKCPVSPDYESSTMTVFRNLAAQIFENTPSLYLLSTVSYGLCGGEVRNPGDRADWPTWVPDFSNETSFAASLSTTVYLVSNRKCYYNASRIDTIEYHPPIIRENVLTVHGARIGIIEKRNDRRRVVSGSENLPYLCFFLELCLRGSAKYPNSDQTWIEAVWRTLMVDCIPESWDTKPGVHFRSWLLDHLVRALKFRGQDRGAAPFAETLERAVKLLQRVSESTCLSSMLPTLEEVVEQVKSKVERDTVEKHPFELLACESFAAGRLYLTTDGFLGSGPVSLVQGDEVWLLRGAKMPTILRKVVDNQFLLVGESYLHGAMYGEFMTDELASQMGPIDIL